MPIVTVEVVVEPERALASTLAQQLADAIGSALASPPGQTWVRLRSLDCSQYAENDRSLCATELPVFVNVLKRQLPQNSELQAEVAALTEVIARIIERPATCVHVEYAPAAAGRLSFGGKLVR